jgi:hypothetical protein
MHSGVFAQVNQLGSGRDCAQRGLNYLICRGDKGDHGPVMIYVQVTVQNRYVFDACDRARNRSDRFTLAAFTEVWYTLNETIFGF